jgi:hypothetical protein
MLFKFRFQEFKVFRAHSNEYKVLAHICVLYMGQSGEKIDVENYSYLF